MAHHPLRLFSFLKPKDSTMIHCPDCDSPNCVGPTYDKTNNFYVAYCKTCNWRIEHPDRAHIERILYSSRPHE
jgi:transcription elongation factor Elf1